MAGLNFVTGNLWDEIGKADLILFTANSTLKGKCDELVMGAGAAKQAKELFPMAPFALGDAIVRCGGKVGKDYGVVTMHPIKGSDFRLGAFQTKRYWKDPSDLEIIRYSCEKLMTKAHLFQRIALNFPGIGLGGLKRSDVLPLLESLSENIWIYEP